MIETEIKSNIWDENWHKNKIAEAKPNPWTWTKKQLLQGELPTELLQQFFATSKGKR